jgi:AcrR family transcriptional regulator
LFSEKGYGGATTRVIAANEGFTEMTLYTRFKNKQNLFNQVMIYGIGKLNEDSSSLLVSETEFKGPSDFLETFIRNLVKFVKDNIEFFRIMFKQDRITVGPLIKDNISDFSDYLEKNIPNQNIDYLAFTLTIFSFVYMYNIGVYLGPLDESRENILEKFIHNLIQFIQ